VGSLAENIHGNGKWGIEHEGNMKYENNHYWLIVLYLANRPEIDAYPTPKFIIHN